MFAKLRFIKVKFNFFLNFSFLSLSCTLTSHLLFGEVIYNFPDLYNQETNAIPRTNQVSELEIQQIKNYSLYTNFDFYRLKEVPDNYSYLKFFILDLHLSDYYRQGGDFFAKQELFYDEKTRWLFYEIQRAKQGENIGDSRQGNLRVNLEDIETSLRLFGSQELSFRYGWSQYIRRLDVKEARQKRYGYQYIFEHWFREVDPLLEEPFHAPSLIADGPISSQNLVVSLKGKIGRKIDIEINHNSRSRRNTYYIEYKGDERELIDSVKFGQVNLNVGSKSRFITSGGLSKKGLGVRFKAGEQGNPFALEGSILLSEGVSEVKEFNINTLEEEIIRDIDYISGRYFQLPDKQIRDAYYYEQIIDGDQIFNADLVISNIDSQGTVATELYFRRLANDKYEVDKENGVLEHTTSRPRGYTLLFYNYQDTNGAITSASATNAHHFFGINYQVDVKQSLSVTASSNFAIIFVPDENLGDADIPYVYELKNHYSIDDIAEIESLQISLLNYNEDEIDPNPWRGTFEHNFQHYGKAELKLTKNYFFFEDPKVFARLPEYYNGMYENKHLDNTYHKLKIRIRYRKEYKDFINLNRFNVVASSVVVYIDNQLISKDQYTVSSFGRIYFSRPEILTRGSKVIVHYEYLPFGSSLQRLIFASRFDWTLRGPENYIGAMLVGSLGQSATAAPQLGFEPNSQLVMNVDTKLDLSSMWQRKRKVDYSILFDAEYAFSIFNINNNDKAIFNTVEQDDVIFEMSSAAPNYYFTANPQLERIGKNLHKSYFIDFSSYAKLNNSKTPWLFTIENEKRMRENNQGDVLTYRQDVNFRPFEVKPGPYELIGEGYLNRLLYPAQYALVFDYDFHKASALTSASTGDGNEYISFITRAQYSGVSRDFKNYRFIEIVYKLLPAADNKGDLLSNPQAIGFSIDLGQLNEDFDLDSVLDEENLINDAKGFSFDYKTNDIHKAIITRLGAGIIGWQSPDEISKGNNRKDTEDLNNNNQLEGNDADKEIIVSYPASFNANDFNTHFLLFNSNYIASQNLNLASFETNGAFYEVISNPSTSSDPYQREHYIKMLVPLPRGKINNALTKVTHVRLNFLELNGYFPRGRVLIDSIRFKGTTWENILVDNVSVEKPQQFVFTTINTKDDAFYQRNHLAKAYRNSYEDIHGFLQSAEFNTLQEQSLDIEYDLNGIAIVSNNVSNFIDGRMAGVEKYENSVDRINFSHYKNIKFYIYVQERSQRGNEELIYRFGKDATSYYELRIPLKNLGEASSDTLNEWHELTIKLRGKDANEQVYMDENAYKGNNYFLLAKSALDVIFSGNRKTVEPVNLDLDDYKIRRVGTPTLHNINYFMLGIDSKGAPVSGRLFINEFHVDQDEVQFGHAYRAGLKFRQNVPWLINDSAVVSDTLSEINYRYAGFGFSSLDQVGSDRQKEIVAFNASTKLLDKNFDLKYKSSKDYELSDYREIFLPKENQFVSHNDLQGFSILMNLKRNKWIPEISHSFDNRKTRQADVVVISSNLSDKNYYVNVKENDIRAYTFSEKKKYQFTRNFSISQRYSIATTYRQELLLQSSIDLGEVIFFNNRFNSFYPIEILLPNEDEKRFPIFSHLPSASDSLEEKSQWLEDINYTFSREQSGGIDINWHKFNLDVETKWIKRHVLIEDKIADLQLDELSKTYEPEKIYSQWYEFYWPQFLTMWQDPFVEEQSKFLFLSRYYSFAIGYEDMIKVLDLPLLSSVKLSTSYLYEENNYRNFTSSFAHNEFKAYQALEKKNPIPKDKRSQLNSYADSLKNFYDREQSYKNINTSHNIRLNLPLVYDKKFFIKSTPINFTRSVKLAQQNVLDIESGDLSDADRQLWEGIDKDFSHLSEGLLGGDRHGHYYFESFSELWTLPYLDFWFLNDVLYWMLQLVNPDLGNPVDESKFKNVYRFWVTETIDNHIRYRERREDKNQIEHVAQFTAHERYEASYSQSDSFQFKINLNNNDFINYFLPNQITYRGVLNTAKTKWENTQSLQRNISFQKRFDFISRFISQHWLSSRDGFQRFVEFSAVFDYKEYQNFNAKELKNIYSLNLNSSLRLIKGLNIQGNYSFAKEDVFYYLRHTYTDRDGNQHSVPYLGIGPYVEIKSQDPFLFTEETLNVGERENYLLYQSVLDLGEDKIDLSKYIQNFRLNFSWADKEPFELFGLFKLFADAQRRLGLELILYDYQLPHVDDARLLVEKKLLPYEQPHAIARKNLQGFVAPINAEGRITDWIAKTIFSSSYRVTANVSFDTTLKFIVLSQYVARSYQAFLKVTPDETNNWQANYFREDDFIQMGFDIAIKGKIIF